VERDSRKYRVHTIYNQMEQAVFVMDFWLEEDEVQQYTSLFEQVFGSIELDRAPVSQFPLYGIVYTFTAKDDLFELPVPVPWAYDREEEPNVVVDTFYSPDEHAVIQNITYDEGTQFSSSTIRGIAMELLRTLYAEGIKIVDETDMPDGSVRLIWDSPTGDYSGISFYETRRTAFLMITLMYDSPYEDLYLPVMTELIANYHVP